MATFPLVAKGSIIFEKVQQLCETPHFTILKVLKTQWLSRQQAIERMLEQLKSL